MTKHRVYSISVASVYPHYVTKAEKKGRTGAEVDTIINRELLRLSSKPQAGARATQKNLSPAPASFNPSRQQVS